MADYGQGADYGPDYDSAAESRKRFSAEIKPGGFYRRFGTLAFSRSTTIGGTSAVTSPPS